MKRYSVYVRMTNGHEMNFETDTNVILQQPVHINGGEFIITENEYVFNVLHIEDLQMVENGEGLVGRMERNR